MCANIDDHIANKKPVNFRRAFRCSALDTICSLCFGRTTNALSVPEFRSPVEHALEASLPIRRLFKHFPVTMTIVNSLPPDWLVYFQPDFKGHLDITNVSTVQEYILIPFLDCHADAGRPD